MKTSNATNHRLASIKFALALMALGWWGVESVWHLQAQDWPQFLGPTRNGVYAGKLAKAWPVEGPPVLWKKSVGQGFSGPVAAGGNVIIFHRVDNKETVDCLDAKSGESRWRFAYPTHYEDDFGFDEGPRATPSIADGKVFTFGAEGAVRCLDLATGKMVWERDAKREFEAEKGFFGMACSPLVVGKRVMLSVGGKAGVLALDSDGGKVLWKSPGDEAGYSSPVSWNLGGVDCVLALTRSQLLGLRLDTGETLFKHPWRPPVSASVTAAVPLVVGSSIFLSASYGTGAALLDVRGGKPVEVWAGDDILSNHYATSVVKDGHLYGFDGRQESGPRLRCVEWKTGKVKWSVERIGAGTVTLAGSELLLLMEDGRLLRGPASVDGWKASETVQLLPFGVRAHPAVAQGMIFARSKDKLFCARLDGE